MLVKFTLLSLLATVAADSHPVPIDEHITMWPAPLVISANASTCLMILGGLSKRTNLPDAEREKSSTFQD